MDNRLMEALQEKVHLIGYIDVDAKVSESNLKVLESYCKKSSLVCGVAKKDE